MNDNNVTGTGKSPLTPGNPENTGKAEKTSKWQGKAISDKRISWMYPVATFAAKIFRKILEITNLHQKEVELNVTPNPKNTKLKTKSDEVAQTIKPHDKSAKAIKSINIAVAKPVTTNCSPDRIAFIDSVIERHSKLSKIKELYPEVYDWVDTSLKTKAIPGQYVQIVDPEINDALEYFINEKIIELSEKYPRKYPNDGTSFNEFFLPKSQENPDETFHEKAIPAFKEFIELKMTNIQEKAIKNPALQNDLAKLGANPTFQEAHQFVQDYEKQHGSVQIMKL